MVNKLQSSESSAGILLMLAAILAMVFSNINSLSSFYDWFLHLDLTLGISGGKYKENIHFWINDASMVVFFFVIGLELKKEMLEGQLKNFSQVLLPTIAAVGGAIFPAVIFTVINWSDTQAIKGWAIPTATDIAFAVGVLALLGRRVPTSLKIFLLTLAIMDDLFAIVIIALFYSASLNLTFLALSAVVLAVMIALNKMQVGSKIPYIMLALLLWACILNSGIHATIAGVLAAFTIPLRGQKSGASMLEDMEHALVNPVNFIILPLFAFVNAGVNLSGLDANYLFSSVSMGIFLGLFFGKQIGIFIFSYIAIKLKIAYLPEKATFKQLYAVGVLCGIGFTMSLFIGNLAYGNISAELYKGADKLAILCGSLVSGIFGYILARVFSNKKGVE